MTAYLQGAVNFLVQISNTQDYPVFGIAQTIILSLALCPSGQAQTGSETGSETGSSDAVASVITVKKRTEN